MNSLDNIGRRYSMPVLHVRGTHYEVGFDIGRTFGSLIGRMVEKYEPLVNDYIPVYQTPEGKEAYNMILDSVRQRFPQYVRELEGMADGAQVPFYKLFLIHIDDTLPNVVRNVSSRNTNGCSTISLNEPNHEYLGHTEDALAGALNHCMIVKAEIEESGESFTSFCYAGYLPGYAMSFNEHGLLFTLNIISAKTMPKAKTPRTFLCRKLLVAKDINEVEAILKDKGCGAAEAMSLNLTFLNQKPRMFYNIEVAPAMPPATESIINVKPIPPGEQLFHCNKFQRLQVAESGGPIHRSSEARADMYQQLGPLKDKADIVRLLGDASHPTFTVFRDAPEDPVRTVAVGMFDLQEKTWSLYMDNPKKCEPLIVLPLV